MISRLFMVSLDLHCIMILEYVNDCMHASVSHMLDRYVPVSRHCPVYIVVAGYGGAPHVKRLLTGVPVHPHPHLLCVPRVFTQSTHIHTHHIHTYTLITYIHTHSSHTYIHTHHIQYIHTHHIQYIHTHSSHTYIHTYTLITSQSEDTVE